MVRQKGPISNEQCHRYQRVLLVSPHEDLAPPSSAIVCARQSWAPECSSLSRITFRRRALASRTSPPAPFPLMPTDPSEAGSVRRRWRRSLPRLNCAVVLRRGSKDGRQDFSFTRCRGGVASIIVCELARSKRWCTCLLLSHQPGSHRIASLRFSSAPSKLFSTIARNRP